MAAYTWISPWSFQQVSQTSHQGKSCPEHHNCPSFTSVMAWSDPNTIITLPYGILFFELKILLDSIGSLGNKLHNGHCVSDHYRPQLCEPHWGWSVAFCYEQVPCMANCEAVSWEWTIKTGENSLSQNSSHATNCAPGRIAWNNCFICGNSQSCQDINWSWSSHWLRPTWMSPRGWHFA